MSKTIPQRIADILSPQEIAALQGMMVELAERLSEPIKAFIDSGKQAAQDGNTAGSVYGQNQALHLQGKQAGYRYVSRLFKLALADADERQAKYQARAEAGRMFAKEAKKLRRKADSKE